MQWWPRNCGRLSPSVCLKSKNNARRAQDGGTVCGRALQIAALWRDTNAGLGVFRVNTPNPHEIRLQLSVFGCIYSQTKRLFFDGDKGSNGQRGIY